MKSEKMFAFDNISISFSEQQLVFRVNTNYNLKLEQSLLY